MTLSVRGLQPAQVKALDKQARRFGKTAAEYVHTLIERELLLADKSFDEILDPVRRGFRKQGVTPGEFDQLVSRARRAVRRKRREGRRK